MSYRIQQLIILILHLVLLYWIYYVLNNSGSMTTDIVLYHFLWMAIYGAILIRGCAAWGKYLYSKENKE